MLLVLPEDLNFSSLNSGQRPATLTDTGHLTEDLRQNRDSCRFKTSVSTCRDGIC